MIYLHTMVDLPRVFLASEEQRKVYEVRIYETLGLFICLVHYRTLAEFEVKAPKDKMWCSPNFPQ